MKSLSGYAEDNINDKGTTVSFAQILSLKLISSLFHDLTVFICGKDELALRTAILELPMEHISYFLRFLPNESNSEKYRFY